MNEVDFAFFGTKKMLTVKSTKTPNSIKCIIIGPFVCGKIQLLLLLLMMKYANWNTLYLVAPSVDDQHCYQVINDFYETETESSGYEVV